MALPRRRSGNHYVHTAPAASHGHPETVHPPEGYCLVEADLHRATTSLEVASFRFLSQLQLRSAINLSAEPLHEKAAEFFRTAGVTMLNPRSLEAFDGPYDLWEEAAKEALELVLDAANQPMILLDSRTECESACLVGCLRRLQHWSVCAIHDEYHMKTMRNTQYNTSQRFIERFDLDLVTLKANVPPWYKEHLTMLEEERIAEEAMYRRDPERSTRAWTHGFSPSKEALVGGEASIERTQYDQGKAKHNDAGDRLARARSEADANSSIDVTLVRTRAGVVGEGGGTEQGAGGRAAGEAAARGGGEGQAARAGVGAVPEYRLNGFVHVCPLVSTGCKFTAKAWLQDEDD